MVAVRPGALSGLQSTLRRCHSGALFDIGRLLRSLRASHLGPFGLGVPKLTYRPFGLLVACFGEIGNKPKEGHVVAPKSVRSLSIYEDAIRRLGTFRVVHPLLSDGDALRELGFEASPALGDSVLPSAVGRVSEFNANGKEIIRNDLPKEPRTYSSWRTWQDWHGNEHSGINIRTIQAYPRELVVPPSEYITVLGGQTGTFLCSRPLSTKTDSEEAIVHVINLFLELFADLKIVNPDLEVATSVTVHRLNWKVLPPGPYPFARAMSGLQEFMSFLPEEVRPLVHDRIRSITQYVPDFIAVGIGGFKDYVVFGFPSTGKFVFESPALGNATYVFKNNWQALSLMSKKQILDGSLQEARLIHNHRWRSAIKEAIERP